MEEKLLDIGAERAVLAGLLQHGIDGYVNISDIVTMTALAILTIKLFINV